jgi:hypothetical protein
MAAPVDRRAVFITKILDGMTSYYGLGLVIAFPALRRYGRGRHRQHGDAPDYPAAFDPR